jgi:hypothetical protein
MEAGTAAPDEFTRFMNPDMPGRCAPMMDAMSAPYVPSADEALGNGCGRGSPGTRSIKSTTFMPRVMRGIFTIKSTGDRKGAAGTTPAFSAQVCFCFGGSKYFRVTVCSFASAQTQKTIVHLPLNSDQHGEGEGTHLTVSHRPTTEASG